MTFGWSCTAFLALATIATSAGAQQRIASIEDVAEATDTCRQAVVPGGVNQTVLTEAGWTPATVTSSDGAVVETPLRFLSKTGSSSMILVAPGEARSVCTVMAQVESSAGFTSLADLFALRFEGERVVRRTDTEQMFFVGDAIVNLARTGTRQQPSVRVSVMKMESAQ